MRGLVFYCPGTSYFIGEVDDVAYRNRAPSNGDVAEIYNRGQEGKSLYNIMYPVASVNDWSLQ